MARKQMTRKTAETRRYKDGILPQLFCMHERELIRHRKPSATRFRAKKVNIDMKHATEPDTLTIRTCIYISFEAMEDTSY